MDINIALLLATLSSILQPGDALPWSSYYHWQTYSVYQDDCPAVQTLWNPFQKNRLSSEEICLCSDWHGQRYECPKIDTHTNPNGYFSDFLVCWRNFGEKGNRYTLSFPGHHESRKRRLNSPLFSMKDWNEVFAAILHDPRCNLELHERKIQRKLEAIKERKRSHCKQWSHYRRFIEQRYKKNKR